MTTFFNFFFNCDFVEVMASQHLLNNYCPIQEQPIMFCVMLQL